jgi:hypothetical protein
MSMDPQTNHEILLLAFGTIAVVAIAVLAILGG